MADFNADGRPDVVVTADDGTAIVYRQNHDASFEPAQELPHGTYVMAAYFGVAVDDFNDDTILDIAFASTDGIRVATGSPSGDAGAIAFSSPRRMPAAF